MLLNRYELSKMTYFSEFYGSRIARYGSIFITVTSIGHKLRVPNSKVTLSWFALAENSRRRTCYRSHQPPQMKMMKKKKPIQLQTLKSIRFYLIIDHKDGTFREKIKHVVADSNSCGPCLFDCVKKI